MIDGHAQLEEMTKPQPTVAQKQQDILTINRKNATVKQKQTYLHNLDMQIQRLLQIITRLTDKLDLIDLKILVETKKESAVNLSNLGKGNKWKKSGVPSHFVKAKHPSP
mmetsp:Transcript_41944/g.64226  ORF Transcript_41944/g.64226 Transcript_41944/m.64226 type:complete len:109 (+) Transcript_41944:882-1208(+)